MTSKQIKDLEKEQNIIIGKLSKKLNSQEIKMLGRCLELELLIEAESNK